METITRAITLSGGVKVNVKLIIKEEDQKVIAIVDDDTCGAGYLENIVRDYIYNYFNNRGTCIINFNYDTKMYHNLSLASYYRTIATCNPNDIWDEKVGIKVALDKMKSKLENAVRNRLTIFYDRINTDMVGFAKSIGRFFGV